MRWAFSLVLLFVLLRAVDPTALRRILRNASALPLVAAFLLLLLDRVLVSYRWKLVLRPCDDRVSTLELTRITLVSGFWGTFLPSQISTDSLRIYLLSRKLSKLSSAVSSVLIDRAAGLLVLTLAAGAAAVMAYQQRLISTEWVRLALLLPPALGLILVAAYSRQFERFIKRLEASSYWLLRQLGGFLSALRFYPWTLTDLVSILAFASLVYGLGVFAAYLMFQGIGGNVSPLVFLWIMPLVYISTMLPISVGGIGVVETAWALLLGQAGVHLEQSLVFALALRLTNLIISAIGGIIYALVPMGTDRKSPEQQVEAGPTRATWAE